MERWPGASYRGAIALFLSIVEICASLPVNVAGRPYLAERRVSNRLRDLRLPDGHYEFIASAGA